MAANIQQRPDFFWLVTSQSSSLCEKVWSVLVTTARLRATSSRAVLVTAFCISLCCGLAWKSERISPSRVASRSAPWGTVSACRRAVGIVGVGAVVMELVLKKNAPRG